MNSPKLRFSEFEREWGKFSLNDITEFIDSLHETPEDYVESGYPMIRVADVNGNALDLKKCLKVTKEVYEHFTKRYKPQFGDIVFSRVGTCGESVLINFNNEVCLGQNVVLLKPRESYQFLFHYLNTKLIKSQVDKKVVGSSHKTLSLKDAKRFLVSAPCKQEQTKIANFLTAVDEKITQLTQKHDLLTQYKKGVMQQIFSQELRFKDDDGRDFPEWKDKTLDEVALSISNGLNLDQSIERTGYMVTRIETISDKKINLEKVGYVQTEQDISNYKLDVGDILFSNINSISHIGKVVFVDEDYQLYHGMNLLRIVINQIKNNAKFVFYQLSSERMKQNFETKANKAVNQASINQTELKKTQLKIPSKPEQTKIANFLTAIDDKITAIQAQLDAVKQYKQGLLQQMFV